MGGVLSGGAPAAPRCAETAAPADGEEASRSGMRGATPVMQRLHARIARVAPSGAAVLICGESGSGKELVAQALHALGPRPHGPFVTFDCGAMPPSLVASELFGHERGAFTGADRQHVGAFERAHGGSFFLDEIGELPLAEQAALLGVLERRRFRRVGGQVELATDARILAATHRDLRADVAEGRFRLDLYYRLAVVTLRVPPLRERKEDIRDLIAHFLRELGHRGDPHDVVGDALLARLHRHIWPGNVRELRNVVEATLLGESVELEGDDLRPPDPPIAGPGAPAAPSADRRAGSPGDDLPYRQARAAVMLEFEQRYLRRLLERAALNVSQAARLAQMDRSYLLELLRRHGLWPG